mmetsp:Transcript_7601/g.21659  ORF Transcript_7601/g.21659 Transcript_7601/m.21659 type:complete len:444 (+) Transcript_7601:202-1533(+)
MTAQRKEGAIAQLDHESRWIIFSHLPPRTLLGLVSVSKRLTQELDYRTVFRSTLRKGESTDARASLENMMRLWKRGCIHAPSPLRLLRISSARKCEAPGCPGRPRSANMNYGVFLCFDCIQQGNFTEEVCVDAKGNTDLRGVLADNRTAAWIGSKVSHMWRRDFYVASGERAGPVITRQSLHREAKAGVSGQSLVQAVVDAAKSQPPSAEILAAFEEEKAAACAEHKWQKHQAEERKRSRSAAKMRKVDTVKAAARELLGEAEWVPTAMASRLLLYHLKPFLKAPSKGTKKALAKAVVPVQEAFEQVEAARFLELEFLDPGDPFHSLHPPPGGPPPPSVPVSSGIWQATRTYSSLEPSLRCSSCCGKAGWWRPWSHVTSGCWTKCLLAQRQSGQRRVPKLMRRRLPALHGGFAWRRSLEHISCGLAGTSSRNATGRSWPRWTG